MVREIAKSIREYKVVSIATPILVSFEVVMECIIPFIIAELVNKIKEGCGLDTIAFMALFWWLWLAYRFYSVCLREKHALLPRAGLREICVRICFIRFRNTLSET